MQFNSFGYCAFLAIAVFVFWQLPVALRRPFVLVVSLFFYATWSPLFVLIPVGVSVICYFFGYLILNRPDQEARWFRCGVALVLGTLAFFKYRLFLMANLNAALALLGARPLSPAASIALPLGISFYSFEAISYLIDTRQRRIQKRSFLDLLLFIMFWPHLMAGPIVRVRELVPQLKFSAPLDADLFFSGVDRLIWGLVQKNAIANVLGVWVDSAFHSGRHYSTLDSWFLAIAFGLQIYFDFAAYSNMAIGAARLIGVRLPENFRYPYHAANPVDFWGRWHMSLSRWIRDYLFFPLGVRFNGAPLGLYISLLGVMALVGLWHGAGWNFIVWGLLQGSYLVLYRIYESFAATRPGISGNRAIHLGWRVFTFAAVMLAWVPFRSGGAPQAWSMLSSMLLQWHWTASFSQPFYVLVAAACAFTAIEPFVAGQLATADAAAAARGTAFFAGRLVVRPLLYICGLLVFMAFQAQNTQFIYFQF